MPATHETWFPLYVADYLRDTQKLQAEQHGAYLLLLMEAWTHGGAIPEDPEELAAIARVSLERWQTHTSAKVLAFFRHEAGKYWHDRVLAELSRAELRVSKKSKAGAAGAAARWQKNGNRMATALPTQSFGDAHSHSQVSTSTNVEVVRGETETAPAGATPEPAAAPPAPPPVQAQVPAVVTPVEPAAPTRRPLRKCPQDFQVTPELVAWAKANAPLVSISKATAAFRDHTFKVAIVDWPGAWRNWLRKDQERAVERDQRLSVRQDKLAGANALIFDGVFEPPTTPAAAPTGEVFDV